ncbi:MAG TPA: hypothetical protein VLB44_20290 [Kofleriaceae bacterium]|nr:hypothetical protein [Kofleriaceae bacterium]
MRRIWLTVLVACGAPQQQYTYQTPRGPERAMAPITAKVDEANRSGLAPQTTTPQNRIEGHIFARP